MPFFAYAPLSLRIILSILQLQDQTKSSPCYLRHLSNQIIFLLQPLNAPH
ncbi:hypothetical protein V6Z12_D07G081300 [Gossypium hirsutum]